MDALTKAKEEMQNCKKSWEGYEVEPSIVVVQAYAAIAQAEQLKRIADMLEGYLSVYSDGAVMAIARGEFK